MCHFRVRRLFYFLLIVGVEEVVPGMEVALDVPRGIHCAGLKCDFLTVLRFPVSSYPLALNRSSSELLLFGHYWVTSEALRCEISWSEPSWSPTAFPEYAPGLYFVATPTVFRISHALRGGTKEYDAPFGSRPPAARIDGVWDVSDLRFGWAESLKDRSRIDNGVAASGAPSRFRRGPAAIGDTTGAGDNISFREGTLHVGHKSIEYEFEHVDGSKQLTRQSVHLAERAVPANGVSKEIGHLDDQSTALDMVRYHHGGRTVIVDWDVVNLNKAKRNVPVHISVFVPQKVESIPSRPRRRVQRRISPSGEVLMERELWTTGPYDEFTDLASLPIRETRLGNFRLLTNEELNHIKEDVPLECGFSDDERQWLKQIQGKFWRTTLPPHDIHATLAKELERKIADGNRTRESIAMSLKRQYVRIVNSLLLTDRDEFIDALDEYIALLSATKIESIKAVCLETLAELCGAWNQSEMEALVRARLLNVGSHAN